MGQADILCVADCKWRDSRWFAKKIGTNRNTVNTSFRALRKQKDGPIEFKEKKREKWGINIGYKQFVYRLRRVL